MDTMYLDPDVMQEYEEPRMNVNFRDTYLRNREYGFRPKYGDRSRLCREMYTSIYPIAQWEHEAIHTADRDQPYAILNLEFSPDGKILVAACENNRFMLFDPLTQKHISSKINAHDGRVNCTKFLDSQMFATCSNDTTIALWDVRNLNDKVKVLKEHGNWVRSIDYSKKDNLLISSGQDEIIRSWNINECLEEDQVMSTNLCKIADKMQVKLLPDSSKLVVSTSGGFIMIIHNLDLKKMDTDLNGLEQNMFLLVRSGRTTISNAMKHMLTRERNRVEFIMDFPINDKAELITSIQVHPQGWNVISRNNTIDKQTEWTCVHDLQEVPSELEESSSNELDSSELTLDDFIMKTRLNQYRPVVPFNSFYSLEPPYRAHRMLSSRYSRNLRERVFVSHSDVQTVSTAIGFRQQADDFDEDMSSTDSSLTDSSLTDSSLTDSSSSDFSPTDFSPFNILSIDSSINNFALIDMRSNHLVETSIEESIGASRADRYGIEPTPLHIRPLQTINNPTSILNKIMSLKMPTNPNRLTHFIKEANVDSGFVKEICYSNDGRIICSPFQTGIRLLSFSPNCDELSTLQPKSPGIQLHEIGINESHLCTVISTNFSPVHPLLVAGCVSGRIVWYQPRL